MRLLLIVLSFLFATAAAPIVLAETEAACEACEAVCSPQIENPFTGKQDNLCEVQQILCLQESEASDAGRCTDDRQACDAANTTNCTACNDNNCATAGASATEEFEATLPNLAIPIPGLDFTPIRLQDGVITSFILFDYIDAVFGWLLIFASFLTVITLMVAGVKWMMARGDSSAIGQAKTMVSKSLLSLVLLLSTVAIAEFIDPRLTSRIPFNIIMVERIDASWLDAPGPATVNSGDLPEGVLCDSSIDLYTMAESFVGAGCYRIGAKGGPAPYKHEVNTGNKDASGRLYGEFCPPDKFCSDCSGFAEIFRKCAGLPSANETGGTAEIFNGAEEITSCNTANPQPGDLIGFPSIYASRAGEPPKQIGHVWIYVGKGKTVDLHGGPGSRECRSLTMSDFSRVCRRFSSQPAGMFIVRRSK
jgi:hypothetical protein